MPDESTNGDYELIADDDDEEPEEAPAAGADTTASADSTTGAGNGGGDGTELSEEDAHYEALDGVQVAVLRARLRENDNEALATAKQGDLAPGTPLAYPAK